MRINDGTFAEKHPHFPWKTSRHSGKSAGTFVKRLAVFPPSDKTRPLSSGTTSETKDFQTAKETKSSAARTKKHKIPYSKTKTKGKRLALRQRTPSGTLFLRIFQATPGKRTEQAILTAPDCHSVKSLRSGNYSSSSSCRPRTLPPYCEGSTPKASLNKRAK